MYHGLRVAVFGFAALGNLALLAAPGQAQQFSFLTGDRAMQGYAPRGSNDGYQAGGGGSPGQAPEIMNSPYQSGSIGGGTTGPFASVDPGQGAGTGPGGGAAGGVGAMLRAADQAGVSGLNVARLDTMRTLDAAPGGQNLGTPEPRIIDRSDVTGGAGGPNVAVIGNLPAGALGCPPNCSGAAGRASALADPNSRSSIVTFGNSGGPSGGGSSSTAPYQFKFNTPQTQAFASLGPVIKPDPAPISPALTGIPSVVRTQPVQPVTNLGALNTTAGSSAKAALGAVGGLNSGMGGAPALKNLQGVNSINNLMLQRQKN